MMNTKTIDTPAEPPVLFDTREAANGLRVGLARLNRPRQLNALDLEMCTLLLDQLRRWASDESIACVVLDGAGDKGFCAGGDVASVVRAIRAGGPARFVAGDTFFAVEYQLDALLHAYPKPLLTWAHGVTMGGGVGLSVAGSHRVVTEGLRMAMPEIHIGLFPDVGGGWFLNRVPGGAGLLMALTGLTIGESDALFAGLADWCLPASDRDAIMTELAALPWTGDPRADGAALSAMLARRADTACERGLAAAPGPLRERFDTIRRICAAPDAIALRDALTAVGAKDPWLAAPAESLAKGSPTGALVTFDYMRRCRALSLREVLALDLVVARACQRHHDFPEGVRALLIDKDRKPAWSPARMEEVPAAVVAAHFAP